MKEFLSEDTSKLINYLKEFEINGFNLLDICIGLLEKYNSISFHDEKEKHIYFIDGNIFYVAKWIIGKRIKEFLKNYDLKDLNVDDIWEKLLIHSIINQNLYAVK